MATKTTILQVSRKLFYQHGIANVRLQQIANEAAISVGNLAYHFENKEALVHTLYEEVFKEMRTLVSEHDLYTMGSFDAFIKRIYLFNRNHSFCFNNVWEIAFKYPSLQKEWKSNTRKILKFLATLVNHWAGEKLLAPEPIPGTFKVLPNQLLFNCLCWFQHQRLNGHSSSLQTFKTYSWSLLYPHLSTRGKECFALFMKRKLTPVKRQVVPR